MLNNAVTNLRTGGFLSGDIQLYMGLMRGYQRRFYILHKNSLTIFPDRLALTEPEASMSINRKTRMEAINDKKGRFTVINPTSVPKEKFVCQVDLKGKAYSTFKHGIERLIADAMLEEGMPFGSGGAGAGAGAGGFIVEHDVNGSVSGTGTSTSANGGGGGDNQSSSFKAISFEDDDAPAPVLAAGGGPSNGMNYWDGHSTTASEAEHSVEDVMMNPDPPQINTAPGVIINTCTGNALIAAWSAGMSRLLA